MIKSIASTLNVSKSAIRNEQRVDSSCGTVGSAIASDSRGPGFESSYQQLFLNNYLLLTVCRKDENESQRGGEWSIFKKEETSKGGSPGLTVMGGV